MKRLNSFFLSFFSLLAIIVAIIRPPVVEMGLTPVTVPPTTTIDASSIGLTPPTALDTLATVGIRVGKTTPNPEENHG